MTVKTETMKCERNTDQMAITFNKQKRDGDEWSTIATKRFVWADLPDNAKDFASMYGLSKLLLDRTSDWKRLGVNQLEWMGEVFAQLKAGQLTAKRQAAQKGIDTALIELIHRMKSIPHIQAEKALRDLGKEAREQLAAKFADQLKEIRAEAQEAVDLGDLL